MIRRFRRFCILKGPPDQVRLYLARTLNLPCLLDAGDDDFVAVLRQNLPTLVITDERLMFDLTRLCNKEKNHEA